MENIYNFLERNRKWMQQKLFSGADLELVAHALAGQYITRMLLLLQDFYPILSNLV